jgi:hypothetical protein
MPEQKAIEQGVVDNIWTIRSGYDRRMDKVRKRNFTTFNLFQ